MMLGEFKFLKSKEGRTNFAKVTVRVTKSEEKNCVIANIGEKVDWERGEVNMTSDPAWVKAALEGASEALHFAERSRRINDHYLVEITRVVGLLVDTKEDAVKCAAALATWQCLFPGNPECQIKFDNDSKKWTIQYPT